MNKRKAKNNNIELLPCFPKFLIANLIPDPASCYKLKLEYCCFIKEGFLYEFISASTIFFPPWSLNIPTYFRT